MNSPKYLNYETRPLKFTERKMLLSSLGKICNFFNDKYQYIGLGGISFTDFKLFHKELHINEMHSIEAGNKFSVEKVEFNSPYNFIKLYNELSTEALIKIDLTKKTVVWLDYDSCLENFMFEDLALLFNKLPVGSIYLFTCNRELKDNDTQEIYTEEQFSEKFGNLIPFDLKEKDLSGSENYKTIRTMLLNLISTKIKDRNRIGENIIFQQLYNILYEENRGARMYTFGGVIAEKVFTPEEIGLQNFDFLKWTSDPYKLNIPNLTLKEIDLINNHLGDEGKLEELLELKIISESDVRKYITTYKYLPSFYDVRL